MSLELHRSAEALMAEGDVLAAGGDSQGASDRYRRAAALEASAFASVPEDRPRTRGALAVSVVSLLKRAGATQEARRALHHYLAIEALPGFAVTELEQLIVDLYQQVEDPKSVVSAESLEWVLRGPKVGSGVAPANAVVGAIDHAEKFALRVVEYLAGVPLRLAGSADPSILQAFSMQLAEPKAGSFRFGVRVTTAGQLALLDGTRSVNADDITSEMAAILQAVTSPQQVDISDVVPEPDYQVAFLRLVRLIVPDGKVLSDVEVRRFRDAEIESTHLTPSMRSYLDKRIRGPRDMGVREAERRGTLRGLHLNEGWIALGKGRGERCYADTGVIVLEDVAIELVNRPVRVSGRWARNRFYFSDIVEDVAED